MHDHDTPIDAPRILLVTHDIARGAALVAMLRAAGYRVDWQQDALQGLVAVEGLAPARIVLDWMLPYVRGAIFLEVLQVALVSPPPVIVLAGTDLGEPLRAEARAVLAPTDDPTTVLQAVRTVLLPV